MIQQSNEIIPGNGSRTHNSQSAETCVSRKKEMDCDGTSSIAEFSSMVTYSKDGLGPADLDPLDI